MKNPKRIFVRRPGTLTKSDWPVLPAPSKSRLLAIVGLAMAMVFSHGHSALGGSYRDSAHGNSSFGVDRSTIDGKFSEYAAGNCAHCHEMHASLNGVEPAPAGGAAYHALFADNFNSTRTQNLYVVSDNFCFYCHSEDSPPQVANKDYSEAFGGATVGSGPQSIMTAFNQTSYHNLYDIWNFLLGSTAYPWFADTDNPCSACHNSHLAKRNWDPGQPGFPLLSAVSRPDNHGSLWGETQVMSAYLSYEAPHAFSQNREPAGVGDQNGSNTPDFVGLCSSCHNSANTIWSTTLNRNLKTINWGNSGTGPNKHGELTRDGTDHFRDPYATAASLKSNFVLSCLDCHEPHGSENVVLLRRRINGESLEGAVDSTDAMSFVCKRCHMDDLEAAAGTGEADRWEYVHHLATDAPYAEAVCSNCHSLADGSSPISCGNCHGHGMDDSWAPSGLQTGRKTF